MEEFLKLNKGLVDQLPKVTNYDELYKIIFGTNWKVSVTSAVDVAKIYAAGAKTATDVGGAAATAGKGSPMSYNPFNSVSWSSITKPTTDAALIPFNNFINQTIYLPGNVLSMYSGIPETTRAWLTFSARVISRETFTGVSTKQKADVKTGEKTPADTTTKSQTPEERIVKETEDQSKTPLVKDTKKVSEGSKKGLEEMIEKSKDTKIKIDTVKLNGSLEDIQQKEDSIIKAEQEEYKRTGFKKSKVNY